MTDTTDTAATTPKPGPRPGPRPGPGSAGGPKPGAAGRPAVAVHHVAIGDPHEYGRIDADGTVWLKTADGERAIASWQAGTAEEGLAHFSRRFADLAAEVEVLEERLAARTGDPRKTQAAAAHLIEELPQAHVIGDVEALEKRLRTLVEGADDIAAQVRAEREQARADSVARKEALATEAEAIAADSTAWKAGGDRLRVILEEWKTVRGIDRKTDDALWKRYSKAREAFNRRRGAHFAELDRERAGVRARKEELIEQARELATSTDWGPTAGRFRDLLTEWKAAGRAPRDADEALWQQFKAAQDEFFAARNAVNSARDAEFTDNAKAKLALLEIAERDVDPGAGLDKAREAFRVFRDAWEEIGKVPREQMQALSNRARAVERRLRDAEDAEWSRTDPEATARAAQFAERAAKLEEQAAKAQAAGKDRDAAALRVQAAQWREWADTAVSAITDH